MSLVLYGEALKNLGFSEPEIYWVSGCAGIQGLSSDLLQVCLQQVLLVPQGTKSNAGIQIQLIQVSSIYEALPTGSIELL